MSPLSAATRPRDPPRRALLFSLLALAAPLAATLLAPEWADADGALLIWVPALLPPFLLSYYGGRRGAALALAAGMATLALAQVETLVLDVPAPPPQYVFGVVALLAVVAIGAGWISELLHRERDAAERSALTDPLTGLANRRHASVFLQAAWAQADRGHELSVVLFDLDRFKAVNDQHGHAEGDRVLKALGTVLAQRTRKADLSARFGGEEFIAVLLDCPVARAEEFANDVRELMGSMDFGWGRVTVSAGVCAAERSMGSPDVLVAVTDRALYQAKERGRNQVIRGAPSPPAPAAAPVASPRRGSLEGARVVLVDDDDLSLRSTSRTLQRLGCLVRATPSPREALALLAESDAVDLLVTDIIMPDMGGFTLADLAGKARPGLPVLYVSGYAPEDVYWGGTPGTRSAFLGKPLDPDELRAALLRLIGAETPPVAEAQPARAPSGDGEGEGQRLSRPDAVRDGEAGEEDAPIRPGRILIVDDDVAVVSALARFLTRAGYAPPIGLTDPRRVVDTLEEREVDLMVLDLAMGEMNGFEVLSAISEVIEEDEFFPVVMLTGSGDSDIRRRALSAGAMDFLDKPFDPVEAEVRIRNLLTTRFLTQRVARERDNLEDAVALRTAELADTRSEILYRLARAAEYRDDVTGRHAERVGLLASAMGSALGLAPRQVDLLRRTAPLHDIGKIGVPDAILLKPGRLTEAEFDVMKTHTTIGAQILGGSSHQLLEAARGIALQHHERWDGGGYPGGLRGPEISLEARIVAVADAFDTITHARPYKAALSPAEGLSEIVRGRGALYDPGVVEAFESVTQRVGLERLHEIAAPLDPFRDTEASFDPSPRGA